MLRLVAILLAAHHVAAEKMEMQEFFSNVQNQVASANIPGRGRKMAIQSLLGSVAKSGKISPDAAGVLNNVTQLFTDILADFIDDRNTDQNILDEISDNVAACIPIGVDRDQLLEQNTTNTGSAHVTCRAEEKLLFDADAEKCVAFVLLMESYKQPFVDCVKPEAAVENIGLWNDYIENGVKWFEKKPTYEEKRDQCVASTALLAHKNQECDSAQTHYESTFCQWHEHRIQRCDNLVDCYDNHVSEHNDAVVRIKPIANQRVEDARMIVYITCLIELMTRNETNLDLCSMGDLADFQQYNNTYPDIPDRPLCDKSPVALHPGHVDWYYQSYTLNDDISGDTPAKETTGINCLDA